MKPDILVFTDKMQRAYEALLVDHDAKRFSDRANQVKLPDGRIVEFRPMSRNLVGTRIDESQTVHVWVLCPYEMPTGEREEFIQYLKGRFGPPGHKGRLHQDTGRL